MGDKFRIDSHKLIFHPREVARWLDGEEVYPLYLDISPSGACNHRCVFCGLDYMEYKPRFLDTAILSERLAEIGKLGTKSVMYGGEGEPLLHGQIADIVLCTKEAGIDAAITTNGVMLAESISEKVLSATTWIKVSINAGTAATYARIHRTKEDDFRRVLSNIRNAVHVREATGAGCTLGGQAVLLPENSGEMETLAAELSDAGADYLVIKPYSQHPRGITQKYRDIDYTEYLVLRDRLDRFNSERFSVVFRQRTMQRKDRPVRGYERCLALPFSAHLDAGGNIWGCTSFVGDEEFLYGNINENTFREIWLGAKRRKSMEMVREFDASRCRTNCRLDEVNLYLWELTHPNSHVNFI